MKTFALGDIHGAYKALLQCLQRSGFDYEKDRLIALGDVCDGYLDVKQCIDELLKIRHCDYIIGNHDLWALDWATKGIEEELWLDQGGRNTKASYHGENMPRAHIDFLKSAHLWIEFENKLFVHAGFNPKKTMAEQDVQTLVWDRDLIGDAWKKYLLCNIWALDTGAGWSGKLTIMDVQTHEYWQSDLTPELYGGKGR